MEVHNLSYARSEQLRQDVASQLNVDKNGCLTYPIPSCRTPYELIRLVSCGTPQEILASIEKIKIDRISQKKIREALEQKEREMRLEFERISQIKDLDERKAHQLRSSIINDVLNIRCPRCKIVFVDFEGCFALTCNNCRCGFCAWCLVDCGADAHAHVHGCREGNNRGYHGTAQEFQEHHRKKRESSVNALFKGEPKEVQVMLRKILATDLEDLGISFDGAIQHTPVEAPAAGGGFLGFLHMAMAGGHEDLVADIQEEEGEFEPNDWGI